MKLFTRRKAQFSRAGKADIPTGLWTKCESCSQLLYNKALEETLRVCPKCDFHFPLTAAQRVALTLDEGTFDEWDDDLAPLDPLTFSVPRPYREKLIEEQQACGMKDACLTGIGRMDGLEVVLGVTDSRFMMGSMGSVVGERLTRAIERATERQLPLVIISGSGGGARMQEGMLSLMQMAKTSAAFARLHQADVPALSVLCDPTTGGVTASFATLGDVLIAEPRALIAFAGPRVIEQTIRQKLPEGFQQSEFLLKHGMIDCIVERKDLKAQIEKFLKFFPDRPKTQAG